MVDGGGVWSTYPHRSVITLSLGKLLVNLSQVIKRANTPLMPSINGVVDRLWVLGSWVRIPPSTTINFHEFRHEIYLPAYPGNETAWMLTGPLVYPADLLCRCFRGGERYEG